MSAPDAGITVLLERIAGGGDDAATAADELFARVYGELRAIAGSHLARERTWHTLQPTALVHEAYVRLFGRETPGFENRAHFFGAAAEAMRRILVDHARRAGRAKRGGGARPGALVDDPPAPEERLDEILTVDEEISRLSQENPRAAEIVRLRCFGGLEVDEIADMLDLSPSTVGRELRWTRAKLYQRFRSREED